MSVLRIFLHLCEHGAPIRSYGSFEKSMLPMAASDYLPQPSLTECRA